MKPSIHEAVIPTADVVDAQYSKHLMKCELVTAPQRPRVHAVSVFVRSEIDGAAREIHPACCGADY